MDTSQAGLQLSPFHTSGPPVVFVHYQAQQAAEEFLRIALNDDRGVGVIYGPAKSGKKTLIYQLLRGLPVDLTAAMVDGSKLKTMDLLRTILAHFGLQVDAGTVEDCWRILTRYVQERASFGQPPLLILDNLSKMFPSALYALCKLAELKIDNTFALRIILVNDNLPHRIINAPSMTAIAKRVVGATELGPMTASETSRYLFAKLYASGCPAPSEILPPAIRLAIHAATEGWPGRVDALAIDAMAHASSFPIKRADLVPVLTPAAPQKTPLAAVVEPDEGPDMQHLLLTLNGKMLQKVDLDDAKILIGRSDICDVSINSRYVSKHHALLVRTDSALHLLDLNSTNGTFVNSVQVETRVLQHDDIISIGNHGIKLKFPLYRRRPAISEPDLGDTVTMRTLDPEQAETDDKESDAETGSKSA